MYTLPCFKVIKFEIYTIENCTELSLHEPGCSNN